MQFQLGILAAMCESESEDFTTRRQKSKATLCKLASWHNPGKPRFLTLLMASSLPNRKTGPPEDTKCQLAEIVQYTCKLERSPRGKPQIHCVPIPRFFKMCLHHSPNVSFPPITYVDLASRCSGIPAVEITRIVNVDMDTGVVTLPSQSR